METTLQVKLVRYIAGDLIRACAVLALVFLSYAHQPVNAHSGGHDILTAQVSASWCGDTPIDGSAHAPCHACRIGGGADLPPPCGGYLLSVPAAAPALSRRSAGSFFIPPPELPEARGPPVLA